MQFSGARSQVDREEVTGPQMKRWFKSCRSILIPLEKKTGSSRLAERARLDLSESLATPTRNHAGNSNHEKVQPKLALRNAQTSPSLKNRLLAVAVDGELCVPFKTIG
jgi:hypothetical protein